MSGEDPDLADRLQERLRRLFPPRHGREGARLAKIGDRLARVWRVMASWAHGERLMFYWALERAAAEPRGLGVEHLERLAVRLDRALDLGNDEWLEWSHRLQARQRGVVRTIKEWEWELEGEAGTANEERKPKPAIDLDAVMQDLGLTWMAQASQNDVCATQPSKKESVTAREARQREAGWLAQAYAERPWKLPEQQEGERGYALHAWLVKAAVVGGDHVHDELAPELEAAIAKLARATWERLAWMGLERGRAEQQMEGRAEEWEARPKGWRERKDPFEGKAGVWKDMQERIKRDQEEEWNVRERLEMWKMMNPAEEMGTQGWTMRQIVEESRQVKEAIAGVIAGVKNAAGIRGCLQGRCLLRPAGSVAAWSRKA